MPIILIPVRYLKKTEDSQILAEGLTYRKSGGNVALRNRLLEEQGGYCAYSERYIDPIDACAVEHFDPRKKFTEDDNYWNWYAVLTWINERKPKKIEPYLPILSPSDPTLSARIRFRDELFEAVNEDEEEAKHLIAFLLWNHPEVVESRTKHIQRMRDLQKLLGFTRAELITWLAKEPTRQSYITALEQALD